MVYSLNMLQNSFKLLEKAKPYLDELELFCKEYDLVGKVKADHIGLKCSTQELYELQRSFFEFESIFMYQSIISKRRISIIGLNQGLETLIGAFNYLELSDQKPDGSQKDSIDHCEVVPYSVSYDELIVLLKNKGVTLKEVSKPHHTTHDIVLPSGFIVKLSREMLVDKIKREELV